MNQLEIIRDFINAMVNRQYSTANVLIDKIENINYSHRGLSIIQIAFEFSFDAEKYVEIIRKMIMRGAYCDKSLFNRVPAELLSLLSEYEIQKKIIDNNPKAYKMLDHVKVIKKEASLYKQYPTINLSLYTIIREDIKKEYEYLNSIIDLNLL